MKMMHLISQRVQNIKPSPTLAVMKKASELKASGVNIISLAAGEPDFDTPVYIKLAAIEAINRNFTKYTAVDGMIELRKAVMNKFRKENNIHSEIDQITIGAGAKQLIYNAFQATLNKGDEVIIPCPYWVSYPDMVILSEGVPVFVKCLKENNFKLQPKDLEKAITPKTKWVIINSPNNPSGAVYNRKEIKALTDVLLKYEHVQILADDIYEHVVFNEEFVTVAQIEPNLSSRILTVNGVSKSYSMTGWRIGYGIGPKEIIKQMNNIQSQSTSNPCSISQKAALAALTGPQNHLIDRKNTFELRRDFVVDLLNRIDGITCDLPEGAFYVFPSCEALFGKKTPEGKIVKNSSDFTEYLLIKANVAVVQGIAFGMEGFFRISYATSEDLIEEACNRIKKAVDMLS